ncbi:MAG: hypothetical protein ACAH80_00015 [Alphaproteobacteria bacterium]
MTSFTKASLLAGAFAAVALTTAGCTPPPPPPHNEYNITMDCIGSKPERFEGVSLWEGATLYHVRKFEVVENNKLRMSFEKNFRKLTCRMEREVVESKAVPPAPKQ